VAAHVALQVRNSTVFGEVHVHALDLAEDSIFGGCVHVERRQRGCMRFCSLHCGELTPRRFHCQPDQVIEEARAEVKGARAQAEAEMAKAEEAMAKAEAEMAQAKAQMAKAKAAETKLAMHNAKQAEGKAEKAKAKAEAGLAKAKEQIARVKEGWAGHVDRNVQPVFLSRRYGDPEYARLADHTDPAVLRGAHDESEMGVFHDLFTPQRMTRLRDILREFVPADAEVGVIPVT
jgi:hypothetical protein